ncbi:MAG TPA: hypothetical protein VNV86_00515 [Candidatus Acidoferrum sp.]|nr:hypothetical protein [Candidatus Acidoferrum sp.]
MTRRALLFALACVSFTGLLLAGDISGTWTGTMATGNNQIPLTYKFTQDGAKLTGTVTGPGGDLPLADGKVDGDQISFYVTAEMGGQPARFTSTGTVKGEEIVLETKGESFTSPPMTLKRAK